jgi:hypothetical protein
MERVAGAAIYKNGGDRDTEGDIGQLIVCKAKILKFYLHNNKRIESKDRR